MKRGHSPTNPSVFSEDGHHPNAGVQYRSFEGRKAMGFGAGRELVVQWFIKDQRPHF